VRQAEAAMSSPSAGTRRRRGGQQRLGRGVVGALARERLEVGRDRGDHPAGLLRVLVHHEDLAERDRAGRRRSPARGRAEAEHTRGLGRIHADQHAPQRAREQIHRAPLGLVEHDALLQRPEHRRQALADQPRHALAAAQREHRQHVAEHIDQGGGVGALGAVLLHRHAHHHAVEAGDEQADEPVADQRHRTHQRRDQPQRDDRPHQAHGVLQVDELALREVVERVRALLHAVGGLAGVVALVPGQRRGEQAPHEQRRQALAHLERDVAFEDAPRPVQQPARDDGREHHAEPAPGLAHALQPAGLDVVDRVAGQPGHGELEELGREQQQEGVEQQLARAGGVLPQRAVERAEAHRAARAAAAGGCGAGGGSAAAALVSRSDIAGSASVGFRRCARGIGIGFRLGLGIE
jgi:hypothetical protein